MNESRIAVRYARALFQSALDKGILDKVNYDMITVDALCRMEEIKDLITSPIIKPSKKQKVFSKLLAGNVENITLSMVTLVIRNGREKFIPAITRVVRSEIMKSRGITETYLKTAVPADESIKKTVAELVAELFKTRVDLKEDVDKDIIGGFILRIDDNYFDASIRNKLRKIRIELSAGVN
jgi:F-type H+-transporting ATPase subunit delta